MKIALTGHRYLDYGEHPLRPVVQEKLTKLFLEQKPELILSGMALGFDSVGCEVALELNIPFIAVVPFIGQEKRWYPKLQQRYHGLLKQAKEVITLSKEGYDHYKMHNRNRYLVDNSDLMATFFDGTEQGGTYHCLCYAKQQRKPIINLY